MQMHKGSPNLRFPRAMLPLALLVLGLTILVYVTNANGELLFYSATEDKQTYDKNPRIYEIVSLPPGWGMDTVYVQRTPALKLQINEIESVSVEKKQIYADTQKAVEEALGLRSGRQERETDIAGYYYTATFYLTEQGAKKFNAFAKKHDGKIFDLRIRTQRLAVLKLLGPFGGNALSTMLRENDISRLNETFSPIKNKVTWK